MDIVEIDNVYLVYKMTSLGIKQKDLSDMTGISLRTINSYINNRTIKGISYRNVVKICNTLGVDNYNLIIRII